MNIKVITSGPEPGIHSVLGFAARLDEGPAFISFVIHTEPIEIDPVYAVENAEFLSDYFAAMDSKKYNGNELILTWGELEEEFYGFLKKHWGAVAKPVFLPRFEKDEFFGWGEKVYITGRGLLEQLKANPNYFGSGSLTESDLIKRLKEMEYRKEKSKATWPVKDFGNPPKNALINFIEGLSEEDVERIYSNVFRSYGEQDTLMKNQWMQEVF